MRRILIMLQVIRRWLPQNYRVSSSHRRARSSRNNFSREYGYQIAHDPKGRAPFYTGQADDLRYTTIDDMRNAFARRIAGWPQSGALPDGDKMLLDRRNIVIDFVAMLMVPAETANIAAPVSAVPFSVQFLLQPLFFGASLVFHRVNGKPRSYPATCR